MNADRLRRAATQIRDTAQATGGGGWYVQEDATGITVTARDAAHIELWSPPKALLIADWLDAIAAGKEAGHTAIPPHAVTLTDLILGGTQ